MQIELEALLLEHNLDHNKMQFDVMYVVVSVTMKVNSLAAENRQRAAAFCFPHAISFCNQKKNEKRTTLKFPKKRINPFG